MKTLLRAGALSVALMTTAAPAALAQAAPAVSETLFQATTLNLAADGEVKVAPDMASITLGVQTEAATAAQALAANADQMARVMAALKNR